MRALLSVSDKTNIVAFAQGLEALGFTLISTGGTFKQLSDAGVKVETVESTTGFPEILNGRVKTLHPMVHGGILADQSNPAHIETCQAHHIQPFSLVVVNLYPFQETVAKDNVTMSEAIENIDIGGPTMIRSAAKNHQHVGVLVNPARYEDILSELKTNNSQLSDGTRATLAREAFTHSAQYDSAISTYLAEQDETAPFLPEEMSIPLKKMSELRYGENPHQEAALYKTGKGLTDYQQRHGKALSYNNFIDLEAAWQLVQEFEDPAAVIIKHTNPCGTAIGDTLPDAYQKAHAADPVSAFGSIIGLNREVDEATATQISQTFVEAVIAPAFSQTAFDLLSKKPSIRLIELPNDVPSKRQFRQISGGLLVQSPDQVQDKNWQTVTKKALSSAEEKDLDFAFKVVKHVKSNAIVIAKDGVAIGVGAGQMSRVEAVEIAIKKAGDQVKDAVLASDAFFPFKDNVEFAAKAGVKAIVQPGGSKRDQESIDCCDENGVAMLFTGVRHFKH